jgi:helix-turn-helix protein
MSYLMQQKEIAKAIGCSPSAIHYILNGDRTPSVKMAVQLEIVAGICREGWLFPERHWNPYIPFKGLTGCLSCQNRGTKIHKAVKVIEEHFIVHKDFQAMVDIIMLYLGQAGVAIVIRELDGKGFELCGWAGELPSIAPIPKFQSKEELPQKYAWGSTGNAILLVPHFPYGIPDRWKNEMDFGFHNKLKSILSIQQGSLNLSILSFKHPMAWPSGVIPILENFVWYINQIWIRYKLGTSD